MKINREILGTEIGIELTESEIESVYREQRNKYNVLDLIHKICDMFDKDGWDDMSEVGDDEVIEIGVRKFTGKQIRNLVSDPSFMSDLNLEFESAISNNDSYWESYWLTAEAVIEDAIDKAIPKTEDEIRREQNRNRYMKLINEIRMSSLNNDVKENLIEQIMNMKKKED